ncbi:MAG: Ig-like domain-containing protein [Ignavibacteriaceae bacterium]
MKKNSLLNIFLIPAAALIAFNCASQLPPGGGIEDKVPPTIVELYPENRTTNFNDEYFEVGFSEYVDKRTFKDAIFISPPMEGNLEVSWTNQYARVYFPAPLKENVTYSVTIGTDVTDYNNRNRMDSSYTFAFSTGSKIDNGKIEGFVSDEKPSGTMLFAYRFEVDTINPAKHKPDYISQAGTTGYFSLDFLAPGKYRVFAVRDEYRDRIFQPDQDLIGMPQKDIILSESDSSYYGLNFFLQKIDTLLPKLFSAVMTDRHHLLLTFSEEPDTSSFKTGNFTIVDSNYNFVSSPLLVYKGKTKEKELLLIVDTLFKPDNNYFLMSQSLKDLKGNLSSTDTVLIAVSDKPDSLQPTIYYTSPNQNSDRVDFSFPTFTFKFEDAVDFLKAPQPLPSLIEFADTNKNKIKFDFIKLDDASFRINATEELKPETNYRISWLATGLTDAAGNRFRDSLFKFDFKTITGLEFTGLSGVVKYVDSTQNPLLILRHKSDPDLVYKQKIKGDNTFNFERVIPGTYTLTCLLDNNGNGEIDPGFPFPFVPAESFSTFREDVKLPARWSVSNFTFIFNERVF